MKLIITAVALIAFTFIAVGETPAQGNTAEFDKYIKLLRKDLRSGKKQFVAANLVLTDVEAQKFWPIYDQYAAETETIYNNRLQIIKDYAASYPNVTDASAASLNKRALDSDVSMSKLRQRYAPIFAKALSGKTEALFFQVDRRLALLIDLQLASEIPLVEP